MNMGGLLAARSILGSEASFSANMTSGEMRTVIFESPFHPQYAPTQVQDELFGIDSSYADMDEIDPRSPGLPTEKMNHGDRQGSLFTQQKPLLRKFSSVSSISIAEESSEAPVCGTGYACSLSPSHIALGTSPGPGITPSSQRKNSFVKQHHANLFNYLNNTSTATDAEPQIDFGEHNISSLRPLLTPIKSASNLQSRRARSKSSAECPLGMAMSDFGCHAQIDDPQQYTVEAGRFNALREATPKSKEMSTIDPPRRRHASLSTAEGLKAPVTLGEGNMLLSGYNEAVDETDIDGDSHSLSHSVHFPCQREDSVVEEQDTPQAHLKSNTVTLNPKSQSLAVSDELSETDEISMNESTHFRVDRFEAGRDLYLRGRFQEAKKYFSEAGGCLGRYFIQRCVECERRYGDNGQADGEHTWPGYYVWDVK